MQATNYNKQMKALIAELQERGEVPSLLLHVCCAPCASHELTFLPDVFDVTAFYYNPNITDDEEREKRYAELERLIKEMCTYPTPSSPRTSPSPQHRLSRNAPTSSPKTSKGGCKSKN